MKSLSALHALLATLGLVTPGPGRVGLTGGMGAGKSVVGKLLQQKEIPVVDLDAEGRRLTTQDPRVLAQLREIFGASYFFADGTLDRVRLRETVFSDAVARKQLEALLHPRLFEIYLQAVREHSHAPVVVCEAALLVQSGLYHKLDYLVAVTAPEKVRTQRVIERSGLTETQIRAIQDIQAAEQILSKADFIIDNSGDEKQLEAQVDILVEKLLTRFGRKARR